MTSSDRNIYLENIPLEEARNIVKTALREVGKDAPLSGETIPLRLALGRITAEPVWARLSSPYYHAAAMDGYAVNASDTIGATETQPLTLTPQQAVEVNTGDALADGTNAVIMIEDTQQVTDGIQITAPTIPYRHVRMMGEDMVATELVVPANHQLRPVDIGAIAGCGHHQVLVRKKPHVVIIPTGNELVPADTEREAGQIIEYNSLVLAAQIEQAGGTVSILPIQPDNPDTLQSALETALNEKPNLVLILSGSSAGSKDFTASIIKRMGQLLVHGVAVRPGHPVIIGMVQQIPVIGVPGYPVSAALTGELFIEPLLAQWLGQQPHITTRPRIQATITRKVTSPIGDDDFVRVTVAKVGDKWLATPLSRGAGVITSLVRADGLAHIPRFSEGLDMNDIVEILLYRECHAIEQTVLVIGSHDPMLDLLGQHLATQFPGYRLTSANVGSMGGIIAIKHGETHIAGMHLLDEETGAYNIPHLQKHLPDVPLQVITFAHREQGLIVQQGNPQNITSLDDLPRVRYVNRQRGAGTRILLDYELKQRGIRPEQITGYDREEYTHMAIAAAVLTGVADCGMGVRSAALALNLDFVPIGWECYDLVIPQVHQNHTGVKNLLSTLRSETFKAALAAQYGYDTRETGTLQYENL